MTLEEYLRTEYADGKIDHALRVEVSDAGVRFYIHPANRSGNTVDFEVHGNVLVGDPRVLHPGERAETKTLFCHGCAHSAGAGVPFPGRPSGERPCFFCLRNPDREKWIEEAKADDRELGARHPANGAWYDGSGAVKNPMDCYHSVDILRQMAQWEREPKR